MVLLTGCVINTENPVVRQNRKQYLASHPDISPVYRAAIEEKRVIVGMSREQVTAAWGPPSTCSRGYGDQQSGTVCLYYDSAMVTAGRTTYTDRRYKSVYFEQGKVVDW
jgi:hypothetical protein